MFLDRPPADALARLDERLAVLLPPLYRERYQELESTPMRSAPWVYDEGGRVAWDRMWDGFCDLAMAGGPPHKGRWLAPASAAEVEGAPHAYEEVVEELRRGIGLASGLDVRQAEVPGWVPVACYGDAMAEWLRRAIVMENVAARRRRLELDLPASPAFRVEREVRNVITVIAKTSHYWLEHLPYPQQYAIGALFHDMADEGPLVPPPDVAPPEDATAAAAAALVSAGLQVVPSTASGWVGVACRDAAAAVWLMRALVACNVLARREETTLLVPVHPVLDPGGAIVSARVAQVQALARHAGRA